MGARCAGGGTPGCGEEAGAKAAQSVKETQTRAVNGPKLQAVQI
jgi:hypothetical protein